MAYALVGAVGAVSTGAASAAVTPAFDAGAARTAGNLLVCWVAGNNGSAVPATPAGWTAGPSLFQNVLSAAIFYKVAAGADAAPTIAVQTSAVWNARLAEFSGGDSVSPIDKAGSLSSGSGTLAVVTSGTDVTTAELVVYAVAVGIGASTTQTTASSGNNWTPVDVTNNATATPNHYLMGYGFTTANAAADKNTVTFTATTDNATGAIVSFKLAATATPYVPHRMPLGV